MPELILSYPWSNQSSTALKSHNASWRLRPCAETSKMSDSRQQQLLIKGTGKRRNLMRQPELTSSCCDALFTQSSSCSSCTYKGAGARVRILLWWLLIASSVPGDVMKGVEGRYCFKISCLMEALGSCCRKGNDGTVSVNEMQKVVLMSLDKH
jgi:hypothetical protein